MEISTLRRSTTGHRLGGVCAALSERWRVDPMLIRVATILLALSAGVGLVLYAAAWLALPTVDGRPAPIDSVLPGARRAPRGVWVVALVVASLLVSALIGWMLPFGFGPALVLLAVWYLGVRPHREAQRQQERTEVAPAPGVPPAALSQPTDFTRAAGAWQRRVQEHLETTRSPAPEPVRPEPGYTLEAFLAIPDPVGLYAEDDARPAPAPTRSPDLERRGRRRMFWVSWVAASLAMLVVGILDTHFSVEWYAYPAAALLALGLVLVACTWLPRPRGLVLVTCLLAATTLCGVPATGGPVTTARLEYATVAELPASTSFQAGEHEVDLSALQLDHDLHHRINQDAGELRVVVPRDTNVVVTWKMDVGVAEVLGESGEGWQNGGRVGRTPRPGAPTMHLEVGMDVGHLEVVER